MDLVQEVLAPGAWKSPASTPAPDSSAESPVLAPAASFLQHYVSLSPRLTAKLLFSVYSNFNCRMLDVRNNSVRFWCWQDEENGNEKGKHLSLLLITLIKTCRGENR